MNKEAEAGGVEDVGINWGPSVQSGLGGSWGSGTNSVATSRERQEREASWGPGACLGPCGSSEPGSTSALSSIHLFLPPPSCSSKSMFSL